MGARVPVQVRGAEVQGEGLVHVQMMRVSGYVQVEGLSLLGGGTYLGAVLTWGRSLLGVGPQVILGHVSTWGNV